MTLKDSSIGQTTPSNSQISYDPQPRGYVIREEYLNPNALDKLIKSLMAAQKEMRPAPMSGYNDFFKSHYSTLGDVLAVVRDAFFKHGLCLVQAVVVHGDKTLLQTKLVHESGQYIESYYPVIMKNQDPQGLAAAVSYSRRVAIATLAGVISDVDDDGNVAAGREMAAVRPSVTAPSHQSPMAVKSPVKAPVAPSGPKQSLGGHYVIPARFKKYAGQRIIDIPRAELEGYIEFLGRDGKPSKPLDELADAFNATWEPASKPAKQASFLDEPPIPTDSDGIPF